MNARDRQIAVLTAAGMTAQEVARKLSVSTSTVDRSRARQDVAALIAVKEKDGITPRDVLTSLMHSNNDQVRMKAATELAELPEVPQDESPPPLAEGVTRVTVEDHLGTTSTRVYPLPPFDDGSTPGPAADFNAELARLGERDYGDPGAHDLEHFRIANELVYPRAKDQ